MCRWNGRSMVKEGIDLTASRVRCIPNRLGSSMHATEDRRSMVRSGIWHAYQLPRAAGSNLGTEVFCKTQDKNICFVLDSVSSRCGLSLSETLHRLFHSEYLG